MTGPHGTGRTPTGWRRVPPRWRARLLRTAVLFAVTVVGLGQLGVQPSVPLLAAVTVAMLALGAVLDLPVDAGDRYWVAGDIAGAQLGRGADHETTALADHLALVQSSPETTGELVERLHRRLAGVLEAKVWREQGVDLRRNSAWARSLLPRELADFYTEAPDPAILRPAALERLVARIEQS